MHGRCYRADFARYRCEYPRTLLRTQQQYKTEDRDGDRLEQAAQIRSFPKHVSTTTADDPSGSRAPKDTVPPRLQRPYRQRLCPDRWEQGWREGVCYLPQRGFVFLIFATEQQLTFARLLWQRRQRLWALQSLSRVWKYEQWDWASSGDLFRWQEGREEDDWWWREGSSGSGEVRIYRSADFVCHCKSSDGVD